MTYKELLKQLQSLNESQLNQEVVVLDSTDYVSYAEELAEATEEDMENYPILAKKHIEEGKFFIWLG